MKCSQCNAEMVEGTVQVRGTLWGFFYFGFSYQNLYFDKDEKTSMIMVSRAKKKSFQCSKCSGVFIPNLPPC
jgi:hypothetical protein